MEHANPLIEGAKSLAEGANPLIFFAKLSRGSSYSEFLETIMRLQRVFQGFTTGRRPNKAESTGQQLKQVRHRVSCP